MLAAKAQDTLTQSLAADPTIKTVTSPTITVFDRSNWFIEQAEQRTFVRSWEPFKGQENMPVKTLSPVTNEVSFGLRIESKVKCLKDSDEIQLSVNIERTSIAAVETSMFSYENDIGGEPHPIQSPKLDTSCLKADVNLAIGGSLVFREPDGPGKTRLTIIRCAAVFDTPEVAEEFAAAAEQNPRLTLKSLVHKSSLQPDAVKEQKPRLASVYVDCGLDFTPEQLEWVASRHDRFGFESVQIHNGRLRVLAQELAHVETAQQMVESEFPKRVPAIRGGNIGKPLDYSVLVAAMDTCGMPCRIFGEVNYTINREHIDLQASPLEISYSDEVQMFRLRGDEGEIRLVCDSGQAYMLFQGNVIVELAGWKGTADAFEVDESGYTFRGNIMIERQDGKGQKILRAGEIRINADIDSLEELDAELTRDSISGLDSDRDCPRD